MVRKVQRVPLDLMASIQRGDLRGTNTYAPPSSGHARHRGRRGKALTDWDPRKFYSDDQITNFVLELNRRPAEWVEEIAKEGLKPEIPGRRRAVVCHREEPQEPRPRLRPGWPGEKEIVYVSERAADRPQASGLWRWK